MPLRSGTQKWVRNKLTLLDTWRQFFTNKTIPDILLYTNNNFNNIRSKMSNRM